MLRGNPPPPPSPQHPFFLLFLSISFPPLFKKNLKNFGGGGFEPPEPPPLKYALVHTVCVTVQPLCSITLVNPIDAHCRSDRLCSVRDPL